MRFYLLLFSFLKDILSNCFFQAVCLGAILLGIFLYLGRKLYLSQTRLNPDSNITTRDYYTVNIVNPLDVSVTVNEIQTPGSSSDDGTISVEFNPLGYEMVNFDQSGHQSETPT